jgi:hypothetical protein
MRAQTTLNWPLQPNAKYDAENPEGNLRFICRPQAHRHAGTRFNHHPSPSNSAACLRVVSVTA